MGVLSTVIRCLVTRSMVLSIPCSRARRACWPRLAARREDAADPVDVGVGRARHLVVHDVSELFDLEATVGDIGGGPRGRPPGPEPRHHPVTVLLCHAAVQGLGPKALPLSIS